MKHSIFTTLFTISTLCTFAQRRTVVYYNNPVPTWDTSLHQVVKNLSITSDSVFYYPKAKNNNDSALAFVEYFDTEGNVTEREEFNRATHAVAKIINYRYAENLLTVEESVAQSDFLINDNEGIDRVTRTFDHDSAGNVVTEKIFSYFGKSTNNPSVTTKSREYDNEGHLTKEYVTLPKQQPYLYRVFMYEDGVLSEEKTFNMQQDWIYSYVYEWDKRANTKRVYLLNQSKKLQREYQYDRQQRLVKDKQFTARNIYWDYSGNEYTYDANGLPSSQVFNQVTGERFYYKHFYTHNK